MRHWFALRGDISRPVYAVAAPLLLLAQHAGTMLAYRLSGQELDADLLFWVLPLRRLATHPALSEAGALAAFGLSLVIAWALAVLSFRRANRSDLGHSFAALSIVPGLQYLAVAVLALMPVPATEEATPPETGADVAHVLQGLFAGVVIIVAAVLVSAVTFGSYGWGLFVATPFLVGVTTAYIANRSVDLGLGKTFALTIGAAGLGCLALIGLALEGILCILLAAPLGALVVCAGAALGYGVARAGHRRGKPFLSLALLPAVFAMEAAMPPALAIETDRSIEIDATPAEVWRAVTSDRPVASPPGLVGMAGLAYPIRGRINGEGVGAERIGEFSTGAARERITAWEPGRTLAFRVVSQPPAMEEMSPYRRVHAPHVQGYFDTDETRFDLQPLPGGGTRLSARASHILRIDPVLYWEPIARWAIRQNTERVLEDLKRKAEAAPGRR